MGPDSCQLQFVERRALAKERKEEGEERDREKERGVEGRK
jgi:hypothetical protein